MYEKCYNFIHFIPGDVLKALSHEATKLSIVYSKPPLPSNQVPLFYFAVLTRYTLIDFPLV